MAQMRLPVSLTLQYLSQVSQSSAVQPLCDGIADDSERQWNANAHISLETGDFVNTLSVRYLPSYDKYDKYDSANKTCNLIGDIINEDGTTSSYKHSSYTQWDLVSTYNITNHQ